MIQFKISRMVLLNNLWEVSSDRNLFTLITELKDFPYKKVEVQLADAEAA